MSGASEGERGNAYRAIRRFAISCSPRRLHPAYSHNRRAPLLRWLGVEHDPTTTRFAGEHAGHDARQKYRAEPPVDERRIGDRGVQSDVVGIGGVSGGDGILCGPIEFDETDVLAASTTNERARVCAVELGLQIPLPPPRRPVVLPRLRHMRAVSSSRTSCRRRHRVGEADGVGLGQDRRGGPTS